MTGVVIVLFNPTDEDISQLALLAERYRGAIVDNSPDRTIGTNTLGQMVYLFNDGENKGIAEAQNRGVAALMNDPAIKYIVFLDQDSRLGLDYPDAIAHEYEVLTPLFKISLLGPSVENIETGKQFRPVLHENAPTEEGFILRREIISSGSCTSIACLSDVGLNDTTLFIDYVDFEWCWRAASKGYVCGITNKLSIHHHVGNKTIDIFGYIIIISAPHRYFYQYRNHLWLCRRKYVPLRWKINMGIKYIARLIYFPLFIRQGGKCWKYMIKGIKAGLKRPKLIPYDK